MLSSTTTICILVYLSAKSNKRFSRLLKITLQIITVAHTITTASSDQMFTHWPTTLNKFSVSHLQSSKFCYCFEFRTSWLCAVETHVCCFHEKCGVCLIDRNNYIILSWKIIDINLKWPNKAWILFGFIINILCCNLWNNMIYWKQKQKETKNDLQSSQQWYILDEY